MRQTLPQRRPHEVFSFVHWGQKFHAGIGRAYHAGPVREIWINAGKTGTQAETLARDSAVLLSIALQYDVPIEVMRKAIMRDLDGKASGPIGALLDRLAGDESNQSNADLPGNPGPAGSHSESAAGELADV